MCRRDVPNCTREVDRCAEGTSQIAHRRCLSVLILYSYVQFGTSLLHISNSFVADGVPRWRHVG